VSAQLLAPDAAVPHRDVLLDDAAVGRLLVADGCERVHAKYKVGDSLRVVYAIRRGQQRDHVAVRTFAPGTSAEAFAQTAGNTVHLPELESVAWTFPNDRKLSTLSLLAGRSAALDRLVGRPVATTRLVGYAAERSATAQCLDAAGRVIAYAKVVADGAAAIECRALEAAAAARDQDLRVPNVIAVSGRHLAIALEPVAGRRLDALDGDALVAALGRLGAALAALHGVRPLPAQRFNRLDVDRLAKAVAVIARARPQDGARAAGLLAALLADLPTSAPPVHLHGDVNLRNAILDGERLSLIDMEHAATGPAAADLGQALAGLLLARVMRRTTEAVRSALAGALVAGYAERSPLPAPATLRWFTAASVLSRCALPAVSRVRPQALRHLREALEAARELLA
jgi:aminoglycoside phosphotransferase (APT) family kinase protein